MINWAKEYTPEMIEELNAKLPLDTIAKEEEKAGSLYAFSHNEQIFVFKKISWEEYDQIAGGLKVQPDTTPAALENAVNVKVCEICVVYGVDALKTFPGLVKGIADQIFALSGFDVLGNTITF